MPGVPVIILRAAGTNCDLETAHAWSLASATPRRVHLRELAAEPRMLSECAVLTIPGGFSYGDDIAAGVIFAAQLTRDLRDPLASFVDRGGLVLGICNGFQVLVKAGLLPERTEPAARRCTITYNDPPGFQDRWIALRATTDRCPFLEKDRVYEMPIAHGEGRVTFLSPAVRDETVAAGCGALVYTPSDTNGSRGPYNPNGSEADIAGLCDSTGRILGLMPHPERFVDWTQHPCWTSQPRREWGDGLEFFRRAVNELK